MPEVNTVFFPPPVMEMAFLAILATDNQRALPLLERLQNSNYEWNRPDPGGKVMGLAESPFIASYAIAWLESARTPIGALQLKETINAKPGSQLERSLHEVVALATDAYFQPDPYLGQFDRFIRLRALSQQLALATEAANQDDLEEADRILTEVENNIPASAGFSRIEMSANAFFARRAAELEQHNQFRFPVLAFEQVFIAPRRGRVLTIAGGTHKGKSTLGREIIYMNLGQHAALHISLERGDEPDIGYIMHGLQLTKRRPMTLRIPQLVLENIGTPQERVSEIQYIDREFQGIQTSQELIRQHECNFANLYLYRESPGVLTFAMIRNLILKLRRQGVRIDLVLVDYPSLFKIDPRREKRLEEARLAYEFSALAGEFNIAAISISQVNAEGNKARRPNKYQLNESIDKSFLGDDIIMIAQEDADLKAGLVYLISDKVRGEEHGFTAICTQSLAISQFCLDSHLIQSEQLGTFFGRPDIRDLDPTEQEVIADLVAHLTDSNGVIAARHPGWTDERVRLLAQRILSEEQRAMRPRRGGQRVN